MQAINLGVESLVKLNDNLVGKSSIGRSISHTGTKDYLTLIADALHLEDSYIELAEGAIAQLLGNLREVKVEVVCCVGICCLAHIGTRLVGSAHIHRIGASQLAINEVVGRSTGEHVDFKFSTCLMLFFCNFGKSNGYILGRTACGKTRKSHVEAILDVKSSFVCR